MTIDHGGRSEGQRATRPRSLIQQYEEIAQASRSMLQAAHQGDWDEVERIQGRCREMIAELKTASERDALADSEQRRRIELLRSILDDDAQIRARAEPWLRNLEEFLRTAPPTALRTP